MAAIKTLFSDAVVKNVPTSGHGSTDQPHLPEGLPGRSGGGIPEVLSDPIKATVKPKDPGKDFWVIKK